MLVNDYPLLTKEWIYTMAVSRDSKWLFTCDFDGNLSQFDISDPELHKNHGQFDISDHRLYKNHGQIHDGYVCDILITPDGYF